MSFYHQVFSYKVFNETMFDASICLISCFFPTGVFLEINQGMYNHQKYYSYFFAYRVFKGIKRNMLISRWTRSKGECYKTLFDLINTTVTIETMNLMVKAIVTAIVKAAVTAIVKAVY